LFLCRDQFKGPFSKEVSRALKHIKSAVTEYGAHYGFVICYGYDRMVWQCATASVFPHMFGDWTPIMRRHLRRVRGYNAFILDHRHLPDIYGVGKKEKAKQNTFGVRNKLESFAKIRAKLAKEDPSGQYPVIAMFTCRKGMKHYIVHPDPGKFPEMAQFEAHIVDAMTVAEKSIRSNYPPFSELARLIN
jgi:hypothetical protein